MKSFSLMVLGLVLVSAAQAGAPSVGQLVDQFYTDQAAGLANPSMQDCPVDPTNCVKSACDRLGKFGCDRTDEVSSVTRACRGNYGSACLDTVCGKLSKYDCDDLNEVTQVANACRGNVDGKCVDAVCERLGSFGCNSREKVVPIARQCGGGY
ncbi:MAG: hypothetical protein AB7F66_16260 [Bacteriovoracia bacterium]